MNINEATFLFSLGLGMIVGFYMMSQDKKNDMDLLAFISASFFFGVMFFCLIGGIYWMIKNF